MHHHRRIEQRLSMKLVQPHKVLHIRVFLEALHGAFICQVVIRVDKNCAEGHPRGNSRTACFLAHVLHIQRLNALPGHDVGQTHPTVTFHQPSSKGQEEFFYRKLLSIVPIIHRLLPHIHSFSPKSLLFEPLYDITLLNFLGAFIFYHSQSHTCKRAGMAPTFDYINPISVHSK